MSTNVSHDILQSYTPYLSHHIGIGLCLKDSKLEIKAMEFGSLKYMGQVRMIAVYNTSDISGINASQQYRLQQGEN